MRTIGLVLILVGIILLLSVGYNFFKEKNKVVSPIPEEKGVRVIFVTPEEKR